MGGQVPLPAPKSDGTRTLPTTRRGTGASTNALPFSFLTPCDTLLPKVGGQVPLPAPKSDGTRTPRHAPWDRRVHHLAPFFAPDPMRHASSQGGRAGPSARSEVGRPAHAPPRAVGPARPPQARLRSLVVVAFLALASAAFADDAFEARRDHLLDHVRTHLLGSGNWRPDASGLLRNRAVNDVGKHWWPRILAELHADPSGNSVITQRDGSTFTVRELIAGLIRNAPDDRPGSSPPNPAIGYLYFSPVGLGWVLHGFPDVLTDDDRRTLFTHALRYDPSFSALNMFTGQGTENHMLMGRTGGYLIAQAIAARGAEDPVSGDLHVEAVERLEQLKPYFIESARSTYLAGFGEWDSSIYYPYVITCWTAMYDFATDLEVRRAAHAVLDWVAATVALRTTAGIFAGAEQRSNAPTRSGESNLDQAGWLWWGGLPGDAAPSFSRQDYSQLVYPALSDYRPPAVIGRVARKELSEDHWGRLHFETKPSYLTHGDKAVRQQTRVLTYLERDYTLGAAIARPTGGWTGGDNQDLLWKLVARNPDGSAAVVHGAQARDPWRQVGMWNNVLIDVWHRPANAEALRDEAMALVADWRERRGVALHRTFPQDTSRENTVRPREVTIEGRRAQLTVGDGRPLALPGDGSPVFAQLGDAYLVVRAVGHGLDPLPPGGYGGFVLEVGSRREHGSFETFKTQIADRDRRTPPTLSPDGRVALQTLGGHEVEFAYETAGTYVEPEFDWGYGAEKEGGYVIMAMPPFQFPAWPTGEGHGRVPRLVIDGRPIEVYFTDATYAGPNLTVHDGVLTVTDGRDRHRIDWRGKVQ